MAENIVDTEWQRCLAGPLRNNLFLNSPLGKTAFACGMAFAVNLLTANWSEEELDRLRMDLREFMQAYMQAYMRER